MNQSFGSAFGGRSLLPAIKLLILANAAVFVLNALVGGRLSDSGAWGRGWLALSWDGLWDGYGLGFLRLFTYQFTHDWSDPWHLLMNLLVLFFFGGMAEAALGYRGTIRLYLMGGLLGGALQILLAKAQGLDQLTVVGASGSCYAMLLYAACLAPRSTVILLVFPLQLWVLAAFLVGIGVYQTYVELLSGRTAGVAHSAHLGGAAMGFLAHRFRLGWFHTFDHGGPHGSLLARLREAWRRGRAVRDAARDEADRARLDQLLDKVHRQGLSSLSDAERAFLTRSSQQRR